MTDAAKNLLTLPVAIPFVKRRIQTEEAESSFGNFGDEDKILKKLDVEPPQKVISVTRHMPLPPGLNLDSKYLNVVSKFDEFVEKQEREKMNDMAIEEANKKKKEDKDEWLARAMKRNTEILGLVERVRPLSKNHSFSTRIVQKYSRFSAGTRKSTVPSSASDTQERDTTQKKVFDHSDICTTTEERSVVSREALIQLIHQHFQTKGYLKAGRVLAQESDNGVGRTDPSYVRALLQMGISDSHKVYKLPTGSEVMVDLDADTEVQTSSIMNHLDPDHVADKKKKLWNELCNQDEDNLECMDDHKTIRAGSLNKLVEKLTDHIANDAKFFKTFLCTYRSFTVPEMLLAKLLERYKVPDVPNDPNIPDEEWKNIKFQIQIRTGNVIQKWIENYFQLDWNHQMVHMLTLFIDDFLLRSKATATMGKTIRSKLNRKILKQDETAEQIFSHDPPNPIVPKNIFSAKLELFDIDPVELARQLTIREYELYKLIEPTEFLNLAWSKEKLKHRARNVIEMTFRFNSASNWTAHQILSTKSLKERKAKMKKILDIAKACLKLNNISTLKAILAGLQNAAVHRLKFTTEDLGKQYLDEYDNMLNVTNQDRNFRNLRAHILSCSPPLVPFLGVYLTDLTFIEDGNPDFFQSKKTGRSLINWTKRKLVFNVIQEIQQYQYKPYNLQKVFQIQQVIEQTFKNHVYLDDPELYKISLEREPRSADLKSLIP